MKPVRHRVVDLVQASLDDDKAEHIVAIDLTNKASFADTIIIATGRSARQVGAMAEHLREKLKAAGHRVLSVEGLQVSDWVLVDAGDVVIHLFQPEVRKFYNLEKMWGGAAPDADDERHVELIA